MSIREFNEENVKAATEQASEIIENLRAVKGDKYAHLVSGFLMGSQLLQSIGMLLSDLEKKGVIGHGEQAYNIIQETLSGAFAHFLGSTDFSGAQDELLTTVKQLQDLTTFRIPREEGAPPGATLQ